MKSRALEIGEAIRFQTESAQLTMFNLFGEI